MTLRPSSVAAAVALALISACSVRDAACGAKRAGTADPVAAQKAADAAAAPRTVKIAFLGDSVSAGFGLMSEQAFPVLIEEQFLADGYPEVEVVNAGITGDTTAGGLRRLEQILEPDVRILVIELGANDALRGLTLEQTRANLAKMIDTALSSKVDVLLTGMEAPTNMGTDYQDGFRALFGQLARDYKDRIAYVPFLLEGVAGHPELNQADGIHPNVDGAKVIAENVYPKLRAQVDGLIGGGGE